MSLGSVCICLHCEIDIASKCHTRGPISCKLCWKIRGNIGIAPRFQAIVLSEALGMVSQTKAGKISGMPLNGLMLFLSFDMLLTTAWFIFLLCFLSVSRVGR